MNRYVVHGLSVYNYHRWCNVFRLYLRKVVVPSKTTCRDTIFLLLFQVHSAKQIWDLTRSFLDSVRSCRTPVVWSRDTDLAPFRPHTRLGSVLTSVSLFVPGSPDSRSWVYPLPSFHPHPNNTLTHSFLFRYTLVYNSLLRRRPSPRGQGESSHTKRLDKLVPQRTRDDKSSCLRFKVD